MLYFDTCTLTAITAPKRMNPSKNQPNHAPSLMRKLSWLFLIPSLAIMGCSVSPAQDAAPSAIDYLKANIIAGNTPPQTITKHPIPRVELPRPPPGKPWVYVMPDVTKHLLPYVEAEGIAESWPIFWVSDSEVAYTVRKAYTFQLSAELRDAIRGGNSPDYFRDDRANWHEVHILDTRTGKSHFHSNGSLVGYQDGIATIVLQQYTKRNPAPREPIEQKQYDVMLVGPLGKEERVTRPATPYPTSLRKCPGEPEIVPSGARIRLKLEHGCVQLPRGDALPGTPSVYYRSNGTQVELNTLRYDFSKVPI